MSAANGEVTFALWVKPRSSRSAVLGVRGDALEVAVTAPPVEGAANAEVVEILAKQLRVPRRAVVIVSGQSGRTKRVQVSGLEPSQVLARLLGNTA